LTEKFKMHLVYNMNKEIF